MGVLAHLPKPAAARLPTQRANAARHRIVRAAPMANPSSVAACRHRRPPASLVAAAAANAADGDAGAAAAPDADAAENDGDDDASGDWFEGLTPEEDAEIPGGIAEAMSGSTRLGKAIRSACDELDALAALEDEALREADGLLQRLGVKGSLFGAAGAAAAAAAAAGGAGRQGDGGPRDALAALKRAAEEEAQAQADHARARAARAQEQQGGDGGGGGGGGGGGASAGGQQQQ